MLRLVRTFFALPYRYVISEFYCITKHNKHILRFLCRLANRPLYDIVVITKGIVNYTILIIRTCQPGPSSYHDTYWPIYSEFRLSEPFGLVQRVRIMKVALIRNKQKSSRKYRVHVLRYYEVMVEQ